MWVFNSNVICCVEFGRCELCSMKREWKWLEVGKVIRQRPCRSNNFNLGNLLQFLNDILFIVIP